MQPRRAGDTTTRMTATRVGTASDWTDVSTGISTSCGIRSGGLYCWGLAAFGSIGDGSSMNQLSPVAIASGTVFTDVRVASTGGISGVERLDRAAVEGLWLHGPWSLQAETAQVRARRDAAADFHGNASSVLIQVRRVTSGAYQIGDLRCP